MEGLASPGRGGREQSPPSAGARPRPPSPRTEGLSFRNGGKTSASSARCHRGFNSLCMGREGWARPSRVVTLSRYRPRFLVTIMIPYVHGTTVIRDRHTAYARDAIVIPHPCRRAQARLQLAPESHHHVARFPLHHAVVRRLLQLVKAATRRSLFDLYFESPCVLVTHSRFPPKPLAVPGVFSPTASSPHQRTATRAVRTARHGLRRIDTPTPNRWS